MFRRRCRARARQKDLLIRASRPRRVSRRCSQLFFGSFAELSWTGVYLKSLESGCWKVAKMSENDHRVCWIVPLDPCQATRETDDQLWDLQGGATPSRSPYFPISVRPFLSAYLLGPGFFTVRSRGREGRPRRKRTYHTSRGPSTVLAEWRGSSVEAKVMNAGRALEGNRGFLEQLVLEVPPCLFALGAQSSLFRGGQRDR